MKIVENSERIFAIRVEGRQWHIFPKNVKNGTLNILMSVIYVLKNG